MGGAGMPATSNQLQCQSPIEINYQKSRKESKGGVTGSMTIKTFKLSEQSNTHDQVEAASSQSITPIKVRMKGNYYEPTESSKKKIIKNVRRKKDKLPIDEDEDESDNEDSEYEYSPNPSVRNAA
jgi:hypothetical protein